MLVVLGVTVSNHRSYERAEWRRKLSCAHTILGSMDAKKPRRYRRSMAMIPWVVEAQASIPAAIRCATGPAQLVGLSATLPAGSGQLRLEFLSIAPTTEIGLRWQVDVEPADVLPGTPTGLLVRNIGGHPVCESIYVVVRCLNDLLARLAALTGDSAFFEVWREQQPVALFARPATLSFNGSREDFTVGDTHVGARLSFEGPANLRAVTGTQLAAAFAAPVPHPSDLFLLRADIAQRSGRYREFVVDLVTALEARAYEAFLRHNGRPATRDESFSPKTYFSESKALGVAPGLDLTDAAVYERLCKLWGARHEVVHNGKMLVRAYDAAKKRDDPDPAKTRPFEPTPDIRDFTQSVWVAFDWLDNVK
jgi:hypothetical protein